MSFPGHQPADTQRDLFRLFGLQQLDPNFFSSHPAFLKDKAQFMPFAAHADKQEAPWPGA